MLQQLVPESCFLISSKVSCVWSPLGLALGNVLIDGLVEGVVSTAVAVFQISFVPDFTQTYLTLETVLVVPTLVHLVPAIVAACEGIETAHRKTAVRTTMEFAVNFMGQK